MRAGGPRRGSIPWFEARSPFYSIPGNGGEWGMGNPPVTGEGESGLVPEGYGEAQLVHLEFAAGVVEVAVLESESHAGLRPPRDPAT